MRLSRAHGASLNVLTIRVKLSRLHVVFTPSVLVSLPDLLYRSTVNDSSKASSEASNEPLPQWATALLDLRVQELNYSQERFVAESGDVLGQKDISRMERGEKNPVELSVGKFFALLKVAGWSIDTFEQRTGLSVPFMSRRQAEAIEAARYLEVSPDYVEFPVYHAAAAGDSEPNPIEGEVAYIAKTKLRERGADPRDVRVYRVNGDCMVSAEASQLTKNIVHGDHVAVDTRRKPEAGDTVVAWWPADEKLVVKRYRLEKKNIILYPLAPAAPTLVLPSEDDVNIIGVVIWREG